MQVKPSIKTPLKQEPNQHNTTHLSTSHTHQNLTMSSSFRNSNNNDSWSNWATVAAVAGGAYMLGPTVTSLAKTAAVAVVSVAAVNAAGEAIASSNNRASSTMVMTRKERVLRIC